MIISFLLRCSALNKHIGLSIKENYKEKKEKNIAYDVAVENSI